MQIKSHVFVVTGGGSGLGEATCRELVKQGANVVVLDRNEELANAVAKSLNDSAVAGVADVTDENQVNAALDLATEKWGRLDGLISCAGVGAAMKTVTRSGPHDLGLFKAVIDVNLVGTFNCLRLAAQRLVENEPDENGERGILINTASIAAYDGQIGQAAYAASKGGIVALTLPIARELARSAVRVVTIAPGLFDTPLLAALPEEARQALGAQVPHPSRLGNPTEFALLAAHIVNNTMLNGEVIRLDGALRMPPK